MKQSDLPAVRHPGSAQPVAGAARCHATVVWIVVPVM